MSEGQPQAAVRGLDAAIITQMAEQEQEGYAATYRLCAASKDRHELYDKLFAFAVALGDLPSAEFIADASPSSRKKLSWYRLLGEAWTKKEDVAKVQQLRQKMKTLDTITRMGWTGEAQRAAILEGWMDVAESLGTSPRCSDMTRFLSGLKKGKPQDVPESIAWLAVYYKECLLRIQAHSARNNAL